MSDEVSDADLLREAGGELPTFLKASPLWLVVPSVLLAGGAVMDAYVSPLHSIAPALVGVAKGSGWGVYFRFAMQASGGSPTAGFVTPASSCSIIPCHGFTSLRMSSSEPNRSRSRLPFFIFVEWHPRQYF